MPKRIYNDHDKAAVYTALTVNNNNIRRTSRDTGIPESTIREWRTLWETEGVPSEVLEPAEAVATEIVVNMERVRDLALDELEAQIRSGAVKAAQLIATVGVLEDKIRLTKGLATSRSETVHALPAPEEIAASLGEYMQRALEIQTEREQDIIDVGEWKEVEKPQPALTE